MLYSTLNGTEENISTEYELKFLGELILNKG